MIDVNAYAGNWVFRPLPSSSPKELSEQFKNEGIRYALISSIEGIFYDDPQLANENLFNSINSLPLLIPVAVLNPKLPNWEKSLNVCCERCNIKAVKLYPNYHHYNLEDVESLLKCAGERNIAVIIQIRVQDVRAQNAWCVVPDVEVAGIIKAAVSSEETRFVLGGIKWHEAQGMANQINELSNVWLDISNVEYVDVLRRLIRIYGTEKLLFGTHAPFFVIRSAILKVREAELSNREFMLITETNAINVFKL
jgi:predicted TIM-barrel fold metal-dependent hydrolase